MSKLYEVGDRMVCDELLASIGIGCRHHEMNGKRLASIVQIPERTFRKRVEHPETFRLGEILSIARTLGIKVKFTFEEM